MGSKIECSQSQVARHLSFNTGMTNSFVEDGDDSGDDSGEDEEEPWILMVQMPGFDGTVTFQSLNGDPLPDCIGEAPWPVPPVSDDDGVSIQSGYTATTEGKI